MKKNIILSALVGFAVIACAIFVNNGLVYLVASLMALVVISVIHSNRSKVMRMTRWAKANPKKAQVYITVLQIALVCLGIFSGYNLKEAGYQFSNTTGYIFSTIMVIGFLSVPFLPRRSIIAIPKIVQRHRLAYIAIALSTFVMMAIFGNRLGNDYPDSPITQAVRAIDHAIFPKSILNTEMYTGESIYESSNRAVFAVYTIPENESIAPTLSEKEIKEKLKAEKKAYRLEKKKARMMKILKHRLAVGTGTTVLAVLLIILLIIPLCAGVCLILGALGDVTVGGVLLGIVLTGGSIWGIIAASRMGRRQKNKPAQ